MPCFFKSNPGFGTASEMQLIDNQQYASFENFANHLLQFPSNGLLRKTHSFFPDFIGCKDTHFSQMSQAFSYFSSFAKKIGSVILSHFRQTPQNQAFSKFSFFANDFAMIVTISQRSQCYDLLNYCNFHRLFLFDRRDVLYSGITFYTSGNPFLLYNIPCIVKGDLRA